VRPIALLEKNEHKEAVTCNNIKMKIAQIAPLAERVPPKKYGGTERVIHALTEELVRRGHEVTLFATGDSITSARLISVYPRSMREAKLKDIYGANAWTLHNIGLAYARQDQFDIIHDHNGFLSLPAANLARVPVVMTQHNAFSREEYRMFSALNKPFIVTISDAQRPTGTGLNIVATVYNGLDMKEYPFSAEHEGYLLFVGRISPEKGVHYAIEVAQQLDLPLIIAAKLEPVDRTYFSEYIEPRLSDQISWIGEVDEAKRNQLMSRAMCFLHPALWKEPFGLTLIEATACGCPVVAFSRGAIPEVIKDGVSGFVVNDLESMLDAVENIAKIDREKCREYAIKAFCAKSMTDGYEAVYARILHQKF
jgi:glycosyltransferase involved in cell wall biosynthesis